MEIVLPTLFQSWASYFHGIDIQEAVQKKTIEPSELWTQTELRAKRIFGWEEKTSSNEMNIVTCLCDVWMVFFLHGISLFCVCLHVIICCMLFIFSRSFSILSKLCARFWHVKLNLNESVERERKKNAPEQFDLKSSFCVVWLPSNQPTGRLNGIIFAFPHFRWASVPWFRHCFRCKLLWVALKTICSIWCWWRWLQCIQMTEAEIFDLRFSPNF